MNDHRLKAWSELMLFTVKGSHRCFLLFVLHDLMQYCWDENPDNRPDASECYRKLTKLYQEFGDLKV